MSEVSQPLKPRSDLGVRTLSGIAMMAVAIAAISYGGWLFVALIIGVGLAVYWEWVRLVNGFVFTTGKRAAWYLGGLIYVGLACFTLIVFGATFFGMTPAIMLISGVIGTDIGAYFSGRSFGGPKIAPKISPSKTWSGLFGGMIGAGAMMVLAQVVINLVRHENTEHWLYPVTTTLFVGAAMAVIAQAGDFFESWMKRRAGVKDSGNLIPGHGGFFDRVDGLIAVLFVSGLVPFVFYAYDCIRLGVLK